MDKLLIMSNFSICHNVIITLPFIEIFLNYVDMFSKSSAADLLYAGNDDMK